MNEVARLLGFLIDCLITGLFYALCIGLLCAYIHKRRTRYVKHGF